MLYLGHEGHEAYYLSVYLHLISPHYEGEGECSRREEQCVDP
jgi:hypothetical protein